MNNNLLFLAYPYEDTVLTSLRFGSGYSMPGVYTGNANVTQISSSINATHFTLLFRCENCLTWDQNGQTGNATTSKGRLVLGWAQSTESPSNPSCPDNISLVQHDNQGIISATLDENAASASYEDWVKLANKTVPGDCSGDGGGGNEPTPVPVPDGATYDYIVVGGGAGGIPVADRLSEAGHSVLLIEKGPPSSGRWGGTMKPSWLDDTNLTRFDVPGLCNQIWVDSNGIACSDTDQMAGCVLGGGTAVNAGLWWRSSDMQASADRVFSRIPGTTTPSTDGKLYYQQGADILFNGLQSAGWSSVTLNDVPAQKTKTFGHAPFMFSGGERGGPMGTYLVSASERDNFARWSNTTVKRVVREGGRITGVEVEATLNGGYAGTVNDQLSIVKNSTDGETMIAESEWIELPVGENLVDHVNVSAKRTGEVAIMLIRCLQTDVVVTHPDVVFYDFKAAYKTPIESDATSYLNINHTVDAMTISQYLGRGSTSRGRMTITAGLDTVVSTLPFLRDESDVNAVIQGIQNLKMALNGTGFTWNYPSRNTSIAEFVKTVSAEFWKHVLRTCKIGTDDGRTGGSAVVDLNTKVYGTDNLFVVDASIFPGMITTNPSAYIVTVAEHAAEKILAL
ncbi:unnamed protein product [Aspergillus oryzae var. brunneus]|uniref:Unnamed protein product n=2 Tax=Aspergillus oryzae TaxID=5062 RepID=A0AAN5BZ13_ASPOZ|nr:unnamed protein product [Aspergillus oryzae]GMG47786.1 unnamed protein product [Aspergillus oryzae var. brunneus]